MKTQEHSVTKGPRRPSATKSEGLLQRGPPGPTYWPAGKVGQAALGETHGPELEVLVARDTPF